MTFSSVIKSVSIKAAGVCVLALGLTLGGCNNKLKDENAALMSQNQALIAENNQLKTNEAALLGQISTLQQQAASAQSPAFNGDWGGGSGGSTRGNRSGREEIFVVAGDVLFDSGQATLKSSAKKELDRIANRIKSEHSGQRVRVEGYTDTDPIRKSKWGSNEALSEARAEAVRNYLVSKGIPSSRVSAVGMGAAKPKATKKDSRRVEIVVVGD
jgi:outer membrane protein OmpA-like peptidoglycan-associated protein